MRIVLVSYLLLTAVRAEEKPKRENYGSPVGVATSGGTFGPLGGGVSPEIFNALSGGVLDGPSGPFSLGGTVGVGVPFSQGGPVGVGVPFSQGGPVGVGALSGQDKKVTGSVHVHIAPDMPAPPPIRVQASGNSKKHYQIVYIKTPSMPPPEIRLPKVYNKKEEKTLIYVLSENPKQPLPPVVDNTFNPSKPEVFLIKYDRTAGGGYRHGENYGGDVQSGYEGSQGVAGGDGGQGSPYSAPHASGGGQGSPYSAPHTGVQAPQVSPGGYGESPLVLEEPSAAPGYRLSGGVSQTSHGASHLVSNQQYKVQEGVSFSQLAPQQAGGRGHQYQSSETIKPAGHRPPAPYGGPHRRPPVRDSPIATSRRPSRPSPQYENSPSASQFQHGPDSSRPHGEHIGSDEYVPSSYPHPPRPTPSYRPDYKYPRLSTHPYKSKSAGEKYPKYGGPSSPPSHGRYRPEKDSLGKSRRPPVPHRVHQEYPRYRRPQSEGYPPRPSTDYPKSRSQGRDATSYRPDHQELQYSGPPHQHGPAQNGYKRSLHSRECQH